MPGAGLVVAGAVESDRGGDHAEDQDERGRERRQVEAGAADRVGAEGERGAGAVHGEEHAADSRRHATEAREQGGADKPDPPRPAQAEDRGRQPRPGGSDRERADRVSHPALSRVEVERQCRDSVLEPPDRDQQPLEQGQRAWRAAGDVHVDGHDAIDRAVHELVPGVDAAERAGSDRDHDLRVGGGIVGLQEQVVRGADRGPGHHQQVGVPRRRREEEPESMEVVVRGGEQPDLGLAHRARAGVHRADVQAAAERPRQARRRSSPDSSSSPGLRSRSIAANVFLGPPRIGTRFRSAARSDVASTNSPLGCTAPSPISTQRPQPVQRPRSTSSSRCSRDSAPPGHSRDEPVDELDGEARGVKRRRARQGARPGVDRLRVAGGGDPPAQPAVEPERHQRANPATVSQKLASMIGMSVNTF